jgi:hypothetical protein
MLTKRLWDGAEAARSLGISESAFWRLVNEGRIPKIDLSGTGKGGRGRKLWRFREADLVGYIEANIRFEGKAPAESPELPKLIGRDALLAAGWDGDAHSPRRRRATK